MVKVKDYVFRAYEDSIVALRSPVLLRRYGGSLQDDYCIAYGFVDEECGSSFYVLGIAETEDFHFREAECPVTVRYSVVKDDPVKFSFPCSRELRRKLYEKADAFMKRRNITGKCRSWRKYGWLDRYRLNEHPDMIAAPVQGHSCRAVMKLYAEDENYFYGRIVECGGEEFRGMEAKADKKPGGVVIHI